MASTMASIMASTMASTVQPDDTPCAQVLTVEPGLYFNAYCLKMAMINAKQAPLLNKQKVKEYQVRTPSQSLSLSLAMCTREQVWLGVFALKMT